MNLINKLLPPISKEFADQLDKAFRPVTIVAGIDRDEIMISVGERRVVDYIFHNSHQRTVTGEPEALADNPPPGAVYPAPKKSMWDRFSNRHSE